METSDLKTTPTNSASPSMVAVRKHFDPTRLLVQRDRLPWFWFAFTVAVLLLSAIDRYHIVSQFKQRERVVIIDPAGTYYLSPLLQFSEAKELHVQQAELATLAFLERSPKDFDNPDLLKLVFLKSARRRTNVSASPSNFVPSNSTRKLKLAALTFSPRATTKCWPLSPAKSSAAAYSRTRRSPRRFRSRSGYAWFATPTWR
jgi:hypothetical protein